MGGRASGMAQAARHREGTQGGVLPGFSAAWLLVKQTLAPHQMEQAEQRKTN